MGKRIAALLVCLVVLCPSALAYWVSDDETVYVTPTGECYHQETCGYVTPETAEGMTLRQAVADGYRGCSWCIGEDNSQWEQYGDWLWYNPFVGQWRDEDGYLYEDPSEAYEAMGYYLADDGYTWIGDNGYLVDGEYHPYPEDMPEYCNECGTIDGHSETCSENQDVNFSFPEQSYSEQFADAEANGTDAINSNFTYNEEKSRIEDMWFERFAWGTGGLAIGLGSVGLYRLFKKKE